MKVTLNDNQSQQEKELKYPLLAKNNGNNMIAYFISENAAVILDKAASHYFKEGEYEDALTSINGGDWEILPKGVTITLENE